MNLQGNVQNYCLFKPAWLQALGYGMLDKDGNQVPFGAKGLKELETITDEYVLPELKECNFRIACDVTNVLCGEQGCSAVFSPQKGATPSMIMQMDKWLAYYAKLTVEKYPHANAKQAGTGAAGGLGFAFLSYMNAVLESGILAGALIKTGSAEKIAETIVDKLGEKRAIIAISIATMIICAVGVFVDISVITVAPIAIAIGQKAGLSKSSILLAMIGGGKAGNIISPNPNTIAASEAFGVDLTALMMKNIIPALFALVMTVVLATILSRKNQDRIDNTDERSQGKKLPGLAAALSGPLVVIILLALRPICNISIDPLIALPLGGVVSIAATGNIKETIPYTEFGLSKVIGVTVLLIGTGTIAAQTFAPTLLEQGVSALSAAAMIHAGSTVIDSLPHGSFFHAIGGAVGMNIKDRMKLIPYEACIGLTSTVIAVMIYLIVA